MKILAEVKNYRLTHDERQDFYCIQKKMSDREIEGMKDLIDAGVVSEYKDATSDVYLDDTIEQAMLICKFESIPLDIANELLKNFLKK